MRNESIKKMFLVLTAVMFFALLGCNVAQTPAVQPGIDAPEQSENLPVFEEDQYFENGVNQRYLKERGITEEQLYEEIARNLEEESLENDSRGAADYLKFIDFNDILRNPTKYFSIKINAGNPNNSYIDIALNRTSLNNMLARLPKFRLKGDRTQKVDAYNFRLHSLSNNNIIISASLRYRRYVRIFGGSMKVLDIRGRAEIQANFHYDAASRELVLTGWKTRKIKLKNFLLNFIKNILVKVFRVKALHPKGSLSERLPLTFLPRQYITFNKFFTANNNLTVRLKITRNCVNKVKKYIRRFGFRI